MAEGNVNDNPLYEQPRIDNVENAQNNNNAQRRF